MYYLGIDGGGSKTGLAVSDSNGNAIAWHTGGPSNPLSVPMNTIKKTIVMLLERVQEKIELSEISSVCAGIAGLENSHSKKDLELFLHSQFDRNTHVQLCHDALTALYSGTNGRPGIVNIAGTGSITFGLTESGEFVRTGGWGYLLDHSGSGYGIGRAALQKVFEAHDGINSKTELTARVLQRFEVEEPPQLIPFIYGHEDSRTKIASLCKEVFELFKAGEPHAIEIIERAAYDISCSIQNLIHKDFPEQQNINVVLTGSVFKSWDIMMPMLKKHLPAHVELIEPKSPPISGSIIESYQAVNGPCPTAFTDRLHRSLSEVEGA